MLPHYYKFQIQYRVIIATLWIECVVLGEPNLVNKNLSYTLYLQNMVILRLLITMTYAFTEVYILLCYYFVIQCFSPFAFREVRKLCRSRILINNFLAYRGALKWTLDLIKQFLYKLESPNNNNIFAPLEFRQFYFAIVHMFSKLLALKYLFLYPIISISLPVMEKTTCYSSIKTMCLITFIAWPCSYKR